MKLPMLKKMAGVIAAGLFSAALTSQAVAATDGTPGPTSTGNLNIKLLVNDVVRISDLDDINLGFFNGSNMQGSDDVCVYRNATGAYNITASGNGPASAFTLSDGVNHVPYTVQYSDGSGFSPMISGAVLNGQTGADTSSFHCANTGVNATVKVDVNASDLAGMPQGGFVGTLTLTVAPE